MPTNPGAPYVAAVCAASAALATLVPVALYQCGAINHLPDPPADVLGPVFASDRITQSKDAHPLGVPDSLLGLASYGTTFTLLLMARSSRRAEGLLRKKLLLDGGMAAFNFVRQVRSFGKLCSWCTGTALATAIMIPAAYAAMRE